VGDSPAFKWSGGAMAQLTTDHTAAEQYVKQGLLTRAQVTGTRLEHTLTKNIGGGDPIDMDAPDQDVIVTTGCGVGDRFLVCSDGITKHVSDAEIAIMLSTGDDPAVIAQTLVDTALARGGHDNIAVGVILVV